MSTANFVRAAVRELPNGKPFTSAPFLEHRSRSAASRTFSSLVAGGETRRLARGVFVRPRTSRFGGAVHLDVREVVEAVARSNDETAQVHGAESARRFGLSTQVPTAPAFHTSASRCTIRVGNITVRMIHTPNRRRPQFAGAATGAALSALWYLGKDNVASETVTTIAAVLGPIEFENLRSADLPAWMTRALAGGVDRAHG